MNIENKNYKIMQNFSLNDIPDLDVCVLGALEYLSNEKLPKLDFDRLRGKRILVVGSGNALVAGRIILNDFDAVFASESTYESEINKQKKSNFKLAVIISASGGKHAPIIAKKLKSRKIKSVLITNNENAPAKKFVSKTYVFPKQTEPYTYNTSTYLSMIFGKTKEKPNKIYDYLIKIEKIFSKKKINFSKYDSFYFIVPEKFDSVREMFTTKFDELFGGKIFGRVYTMEQTKHAKTIVKSNKELFISFGEKNDLFGFEKNRLNILLPKNTDFGMIIAVGYYVIGKIQKQNRPFFKEKIADYCKEASKIFKEEIKPIVE